MNTPSAEHIKAKLRKLLELARQGVGGGKDNAQSILGKLLTKHGLTLDDLDPEYAEVCECEFKFGNALERKLLLQVIFTVLNVTTIPVRDDHKNSKTLCIKATRAQKLEVDLAWSLYRDAFTKEQDRLLKAFIHKNNLYGPDDMEDEAPREPSKLSKEDVAAIVAMMGAIKETRVHKALPLMAAQN